MLAFIGRMFSSDQDPLEEGQEGAGEGGASAGPSLPGLKSKLPEGSPASTAAGEAASPATTWADTPATHGAGSPNHGLASPVKFDSAQPSSEVQPMVWPRTASGDTLEQILAGCAPTLSTVPEHGPAGQTSAATGIQAPSYWPRTLSGDDLDFALSELAAASPPASAPAPRASEAQGSPAAAPETPNRSSVTQPTYWPRTLSGEDLDLAASLACSPVPQGSTTCGELTGSRAGSVDMSTPGSSKVCLATSPAIRQPCFDFAALERTPAAGSGNQTSASGGQDGEGALEPPPPPNEAAPQLGEASLPPPPSSSAAAPADAKVVSIADSLNEPAVGSPERPTKGSWGHSIGKCKPCAFLHTKGCKNGLDCEFCHLCGRGEKKRRQREKWQAHKQTQEAIVNVQRMQAQAMYGQMWGVPPPLPVYGLPMMPPVPPTGMPFGGPS